MFNFIKKTLSLSVYLLSGFAVFYFFYRKMGQNYPLEFNLEKVKVTWLVIMVVLIGVDTFLRARRINFMYPHKAEQQNQQIWLIFTSIPISILIGGGGVLVRIILLKRRLKISYITSLTNVMLEKLFDLVAILTTLLFIAYVTPPIRTYLFGELNITPYLFILIVIWGTLLIFREKIIFTILAINTKLLQKSQAKWHWWMKKKIFILHQASSFFHDYKKTLFFLLYSLPIWSVEILICYSAFRSMDYHPTLFEAFLVNTINILFLILPLSPSGMGIIQASFLFSGKLLALPYNMLIVSIAYHLTVFGANILMLIIGLHKTQLKLSQLKRIIQRKKESEPEENKE